MSDKFKVLKQFAIFLLFFLLLTALTICTFYDLNISNSLYIGNTTLSIIFEYVGKLPAFILLLISATTLSRCVNVDYSAAASALKWLYRILVLFAGVMFFHSIFENFMQNTMILILSSLGSGLALALVFIIFAEFVKREKFLALEKWSLVTLILVVTVFLATSGLKVIVGRLRYRDILNDLTLYNPWYKFDFFGDGNSFPSGHMALSSTLIMIPLLLKTLKVKLYITIPVSIATLAFVIITFITRVTSGAHYMTDVFTSITIAITFYFILFAIFYRNGNLHFDNKNKAEKMFKLGISSNN